MASLEVTERDIIEVANFYDLNLAFKILYKFKMQTKLFLRFM